MYYYTHYASNLLYESVFFGKKQESACGHELERAVRTQKRQIIKEFKEPRIRESVIEQQHQ